MQECGEGGIRVGSGIDGAIIVIVLRDNNPMSSGELLFQVTGDGHLLLPSVGGGMFAYSCLIQCLVGCSHDSDDYLLLSMHASGGGGNRGGCGLLLVDHEVVGVAA
jgi:hypothetical protein